MALEYRRSTSTQDRSGRNTTVAIYAGATRRKFTFAKSALVVKAPFFVEVLSSSFRLPYIFDKHAAHVFQDLADYLSKDTLKNTDFKDVDVRSYSEHPLAKRGVELIQTYQFAEIFNIEGLMDAAMSRIMQIYEPCTRDGKPLTLLWPEVISDAYNRTKAGSLLRAYMAHLLASCRRGKKIIPLGSEGTLQKIHPDLPRDELAASRKYDMLISVLAVPCRYHIHGSSENDCTVKPFIVKGFADEPNATSEHTASHQS